jgi:hypothetical protein
MIGMVNAGAEVTSDGRDGHGEVLAWQARAHATGRAELARRDFSMHAPSLADSIHTTSTLYPQSSA